MRICSSQGLFPEAEDHPREAWWQLACSQHWCCGPPWLLYADESNFVQEYTSMAQYALLFTLFLPLFHGQCLVQYSESLQNSICIMFAGSRACARTLRQFCENRDISWFVENPRRVPSFLQKAVASPCLQGHSKPQLIRFMTSILPPVRKVSIAFTKLEAARSPRNFVAYW